MKSAVEMYTSANKLNYESQSAVTNISRGLYAYNRFIDEGSILECETKIFIPGRFEPDRCIKPATFVKIVIEVRIVLLTQYQPLRRP